MDRYIDKVENEDFYPREVKNALWAEEFEEASTQEKRKGSYG